MDKSTGGHEYDILNSKMQKNLETLESSIMQKGISTNVTRQIMKGMKFIPGAEIKRSELLDLFLV